MEIVRECQAFFGFKLPSVLLNMSSGKFIRLYDASDNVVCTSLRVFFSLFLFHCIFIASTYTVNKVEYIVTVTTVVLTILGTETQNNVD